MSAKGCTFASVPYDVDLGDNLVIRIHDTAGLDESSAGLVSPENAAANLYDLLRKFEDGISLLVFVTRVGRITERNQKNYRLFYEGICQTRVPIALIVTHGEDTCEDDEDDIDGAMRRWWLKNQSHFARSGMNFDNQAIIIAIKKGYRKQYEESAEKVREVIRSSRLATPWKMEGLEWARVTIKYFLSLFGWAVKSHWRSLVSALSSSGSMTQSDATKFVTELTVGEDSPMPVKPPYVSKRKASTSSATLTSVASTSTTNNPSPASFLSLGQPNQDSIASPTSTRRVLVPLAPGSTDNRDNLVMLNYDTNNPSPASSLALGKPNQDSIASPTSSTRRVLVLPRAGSTDDRDNVLHDTKKRESEATKAKIMAAVAASLNENL